jgi:drug/metabolite transporter (DMT)-like permease
LNPSEKQGFLFVNLTAILWGGTALFSKLIPLPAISIILARSLVGAAALSVLFLFTKSHLKFSWKEKGVSLLLAGVLFAMHWVSYFESMKRSSVSIGVISLYTYPVITVFIEPLFEKVRVKMLDVVVGLVTFLGVALIIPSYDLSSGITQGVLWGVFSAFVFALRNIMTRHHLKGESGLGLMFYQIVIVALVTWPFVGWDWVNEANSQGLWGLIILLGIFFTVLPHTLYIKALHLLPAKTVSVVCSSQTVYAAVFSYFILSEEPGVRTVIGGLIVVGCGVFESLRHRRK